MSDIFISYKREDQPAARRLADALEKEGWSVWWDPKLRAGAHYDDVIEKALRESKCVIVIWSELSVSSRYVRDEATYALEHEKLVPVAVDNVHLPLRFRGVQTMSLVQWDGSKNSPQFHRLVTDISVILRQPVKRTGELQRASDERTWSETREGQTFDVGTAPKPWFVWSSGGVALVLLIVVVVSWWPESRKEVPTPPPVTLTSSPKPPGTSAKAPREPIAVEQLKGQEASLTRGTVFRDRLKISVEEPEMVIIPAGSFRMGDIHGVGENDALPVHSVEIKRRFAIGRYEVTFEQYDQFATAMGRKFPDDRSWGRGRRPVIHVSWQDARDYAEWLSQETGKRYRLLTEAEWEYAARSGGKDEIWAGTSDQKQLRDYAVYGAKQSDPVGAKKANGFKLHDMSGNVWEWVEDCWHESYKGAPTVGSPWLDAGGGTCRRRVARGGSWGTGPELLRSSFRERFMAELLSSGLGFRLAQDLE